MTPKEQEQIDRWKRYVKQTRRYGSTYVRVCDRNAPAIGNLQFSWSPFGRSFLAGGHKCKAYAHYTDTGKPVPTKNL